MIIVDNCNSVDLLNMQTYCQVTSKKKIEYTIVLILFCGKPIISHYGNNSSVNFKASCYANKILQLYMLQWLCAEISAIPDKQCILPCKLMFKGSFVLIESMDCQVAYSTLNYSKNEIISQICWLSSFSCIALKYI